MTDVEVLQASLQFISSFLSAFAEMGRATVSSVMVCRLSARPSVRPSPWNNPALIGRIFMEFDIFVFFGKYVEKVNV
jgi:hypothetical protein